ncbi:MAG TPA: hypothetical protein VHX64_08755 [Caulobacteraceae bacterium]|nr:hypothetical protein [Caulobacteraceae bacterium]
MVRAFEILVLSGALAAAAPAFAWETSASSGGGFQAKQSAAAAIKGHGGAAGKAVLVVSCRSDGLFVTVQWPDEIPLNENQHFVSVAWSLDGGSNSSSMLATSGSVGLAGSEAKEWLSEIAGAKRLEVHVPDAHGGQSAGFDLAGAKAVQDGIARSSCG